jgi:hypothetical protein
VTVRPPRLECPSLILPGMITTQAMPGTLFARESRAGGCYIDFIFLGQHIEEVLDPPPPAGKTQVIARQQKAAVKALEKRLEEEGGNL